MLTMSADKWIFLSALCFMCASSNDEHSGDNDYEDSELCEMQTLSAALGSSVLLQCNFSTRSINWVSWVHVPEMGLVHLSSEGRVRFVDPRQGRVKAFPNQGAEGNYSICIDELTTSDLGRYRCTQGKRCLQVELSAERGSRSKDMVLVFSICGGVALILLVVGSYYCMKYLVCRNVVSHDIDNNPVAQGGSGPREAPTGTAPVEQRGADNLVYENDDQYPASQQSDHTGNHSYLPGFQPDLDRSQPTHSTSSIYPNLNQLNFVRVESERRRHRFHTELFSRLRQASFSRHYYVNQGELRQQAARVDNRSRDYECKNPIYNRSADQFNRL